MSEPNLADYMAKWRKVDILPANQEDEARREHAQDLISWLRLHVAELEKLLASEKKQTREFAAPESMLPGGWKFEITEGRALLWVTISDPLGQFCSLAIEQGTIGAQLLQKLISARPSNER